MLAVSRYLRELVALLRCALGLTGGITESEYDRPLVEGRHVFDDLLGERSSNSSHAFVSHHRKKTAGSELRS